jgi:hypothetical protein
MITPTAHCISAAILVFTGILTSLGDVPNAQQAAQFFVLMAFLSWIRADILDLKEGRK